MTARAGVGASFRSRSAAAADVNGDGLLDLFVCSTGDYYGRMPDPPFDARDGGPNRLFLNNGDGTFTDATERFGLDGDALVADGAVRGPRRRRLARPDRHERLRPEERLPERGGAPFRRRREKGRRRGPRIRHVGRRRRLLGRREARRPLLELLHAVGVPPRLPVGPAAAPRAAFSAGRARLDEEDVPRQHAPRLARRPPVRRRLLRRRHREGGVVLDRRRRGPRQRHAPRPLRGERDVGRRPRRRPGAGVLVGDAGLLGRLHRRPADVRPRREGGPGGASGTASSGTAATAPSRSGAGSRGSTSSRTGGPPSSRTSTATARSTSTSARSSTPRSLFLGHRRPGEHFLELVLAQPGRNPSAIGARVTVELPDGRGLLQELQTTSGYLASGAKRLHFGLGAVPATSGKSRSAGPTGRRRSSAPERSTRSSGSSADGEAPHDHRNSRRSPPRRGPPRRGASPRGGAVGRPGGGGPAARRRAAAVRRRRPPSRLSSR